MKSKRYRKAKEAIDSSKHYSLEDAIEIIKKNSTEKIDKIKFSVSLKKSNVKQFSVRDSLEIPHSFKSFRIAVVDYNVSQSLKENKDFLFLNFEDLSNIVKRRNRKTWGFDKLFANTSAVDKLKPFARKLSSKKLFPNSKENTLFDKEEDIKDNIDNIVDLRSDKNGNIHVLLGKIIFSNSQIEQNFRATLNKIKSLKPSNWKGSYIKSLTLSSSMGPGIKVLV